MTSDLENFRATLAHETPDRILYHAGFVEDLRGRVAEHIGTDSIDAHYDFFAPRGLPVAKPDGWTTPDYSAYWEGEDLPEGTTIDGYGVAMVPSGFYHFWGYVSPLRNATSLSDIEEFPLHDLSGWDFSGMSATADALHAEGRVVGSFIGHIYENAWQIRGYEEFLIDLIDRPAWAECLLKRLAAERRTMAIANVRGGADVVHCGDDIANQNSMMFAPDMWRRLMLPLWGGIWQELKAINPDVKIWYHSDGNIIDVVDDLIDAGLDILNPLQPECLDIDAIHRRHGSHLTFDGTIGTQSTMPFGSARDVRERVRDVIAKYGRKGGLIISPTHVLEPEVPLANIDAFAEACREFGSAG